MTRAQVQSLVRELGTWVLQALQPSQTQKLFRFFPCHLPYMGHSPSGRSCLMSPQYFPSIILAFTSSICYLSFCAEYWIIYFNLTCHFTGYLFCYIQYVTKHADIVNMPLFSRSSVVLISNLCHF